LCLVLAASIIAVATYVAFVRLPDPSTASRAGLVRWLVQRDLSRESEGRRIALVDRLTHEVRLADEWSGPVELTPPQRARLTDNLAVLKKTWFLSRVEQLFQLPAASRDAFLDEQIAVVYAWGSVHALLLPTGDPQTLPGDVDAGVDLMHQIDVWLAEASGPPRDKMVNALNLAVARWLATHDLAEQSPGFRSELAQRVALQLDYEPQLTTILDELPPAERTRLTDNGRLLMETWFRDCAAKYAKLPSRDERGSFVDGQIERIEKWGVLDFFAGSDAQDNSSGVLGLQLIQMVQQWINQAPTDQQPMLRDLFNAVQQRYVIRLIEAG
jgi:hypothetical protein